MSKKKRIDLTNMNYTKDELYGTLKVGGEKVEIARTAENAEFVLMLEKVKNIRNKTSPEQIKIYKKIVLIKNNKGVSLTTACFDYHYPDDQMADETYKKIKNFIKNPRHKKLINY